MQSNWQTELAKAYSDPQELLQDLGIAPFISSEKQQAARKQFAMRVPRPFVQLMQHGNPNDPLLRQVLPLAEELNAVEGYISDPLAEHQSPQSGLLHKYRSRVLIVLRGGCAVNCRYCFRRHFPYQDHHVNAQKRQEIVDYIKSDANINEVILSGGDPLMAQDHHLSALLHDLEQLPQLTRLRIHTRLPVVIPSRITSELVELLKNSRLQTVMVLHINHPQEIGAPLQQAITALKQAQVTCLNQAVLLREINDDVATQTQLSETLFAAGVLPYYLHLLDPVAGAAHFDVPQTQAVALMRQLHEELPGFLVPRLVREIAGQPSKTPIDLQLPLTTA